MLTHLEWLPDPREERNGKHLLADVVIAENLATDGKGRLIAIDGKTLRRSHDKKNALGPLHVVR